LTGVALWHHALQFFDVLLQRRVESDAAARHAAIAPKAGWRRALLGGKWVSIGWVTGMIFRGMI